MPTRISGACNACRSKKQKCSGDKSGCAQCEAAGITCTWPEQRKRGPAKGYIEGLEHRLHDAESLLLQLLPHVTTQQLQIASSALANQENSEIGRDSPDHRSSPPVLNKKTGIEYWENFPLTSVDGIRRWQQDCEMNSSSQTRSVSTRPEARGISPASQVPINDGQQKRRSLPSSSASYPGPEVPVDSMFHMANNRRTSSQGIPQRQQQQQQQEHMHMQMNQQSIPWQTQMMNNMDPSQNDITQQQMFTNVGYMNSSGMWQQQQQHPQQQQQQQQQQPKHQQQAMPMDIHQQQRRTSHTHTNVPPVSSHIQSHLFW